ncbi:MAG: gliding motility-associated protein GldE [Prevotellaceae bacterium]|nr:gliding motility-associated protein GldE [Prevotellaceae bacterium]MDO4932238.1 gliding motility-associated protein GldE [Prevotellaceae bacterium]
MIVCLILAGLLLVASGFASGSEIAFFSLTPNDLAELDEERERDRKILMLREDSERTLATILITNNFVNVTIIMLLNYVIAAVVDFGNAYWLQFLCITVLLTFLLLLFGEIIPKVYSRISPLAFCRRVVNGVLFVRQLFWPVGTLLLGSGFIAEKLTQRKNHVISVDELGHALEITDKEDIKEEKDMLQGIIRFSDEMVREIMTSRQDIVDIDVRTGFADVLKCVVDNNYSRIPVYQGSVDNIRGVLYIKDLLPHIGKPANFRWQSLVRPAYFVPETKKIDDLLHEFQTNKVHIAIVVDEFGGTSGIITLEDILEEIVGEINDEYDEEDMNYVKLSYNSYVFEGKTKLVDFSRLLKLEDDFFDEDMDADTIAGLMLELKGDFPSVHESFRYKNVTFEVLKKEQRRISRVKVTVNAESAQ